MHHSDHAKSIISPILLLTRIRIVRTTAWSAPLPVPAPGGCEIAGRGPQRPSQEINGRGIMLLAFFLFVVVGRWSDTVDGKNPANQLIGSLSHYLRRFQHHPRWLFGIFSINSTTQKHRKRWLLVHCLVHSSKHPSMKGKLNLELGDDCFLIAEVFFCMGFWGSTCFVLLCLNVWGCPPDKSNCIYFVTYHKHKIFKAHKYNIYICIRSIYVYIYIHD